MTFDFLINLVMWGGWVFAAGLIACAVGTVLRFNPDDPPLLCRFADKRDQQRMVALIAVQERRALDEDREVERLDSLFELPAREHPPFGGWRS